MKDAAKKVLRCCLSGIYVVSAAANMIGCGKGENNELVVDGENTRMELENKGMIIEDSKVSSEQPVSPSEEAATSGEQSEETSDESLLLAKELSDRYGNKAVRALESVKTQLGVDEYIQVIGELGSAENAKSQGEYVKGLLKSVENNEGKEAPNLVMRACGYQCIDDATIDRAKKIYDESGDMDIWIEKLNEKGIGGGNMIRDEKKFRAFYQQCYCNISSKKTLPRCYCQCSCGWFEKLFTNVLERKVNVALEDSIIAGAKECTFVITMDEE